MKTLCGILVGVLITLSAFAQQQDKLYRVIGGKIGAGVHYKDTTLHMHSKHLKLILDFETGEVVMRLKAEEFTTGIDSVDDKLRTQIIDDFVLKGILGCEISI